MKIGRAQHSDEAHVRREDETGDWQASEAGTDGQQTGGATAAISELSTSARLLCECNRREDCEPLLKRMLGETDVLMASLAAENLAGVNPLVSALKELIRDLYKTRPDQVSPSPLRTITHALDFLRVSVGTPSCFDELERAPLKVLLVDDEPVCRRALEMSLGAAALAPTACGSAREALEVLRTGGFDVVFTDVMMPETDGFEFCSQVRSLPDCMDTPVIFVTCLSDSTTRSRSKLIGGCDLITKPFTPSEMILKAFTFGLKHRVAAAKNQSARQEALVSRGVACLDEQGKVESLNEEGGRLLGYLPAEAVGLHLRELLPKELQSGETADITQALLGGGSKCNQAIQVTARRKDGTSVPFVFNLVEHWAEGRRRFICMFRDARRGSNSSTAAAADAEAGNGSVCWPADTTAASQDSQEVGGVREETDGGNGRPAAEPRAASTASSALVPGPGNRFSSDAMGGLNGATSRAVSQSSEGGIGELDAARAALQERVQSESQLRGECARLEQELSAAKTSLAQTQGQLAAEARQRAEAEERASQLGQERKAIEQQLAQAKASHEKLQKFSVGCSLRLRALARAKVSEEKLQGELEQRRGQLEAASEALSTERSNLEAKARELDVAQAALQERAQSEGQLRAECARLEQELSAAETSLAQTQAQLAAEAQQRTTVEGRAGQLDQQRSALEQELARAKASEERLQCQLEEGRAQLEAEARQRMAAEGRAGQLERERSVLERELAGAKASGEKLQGESEERRAQLEAASQALATERSNLEAQAQELDAARAALEERAQSGSQLQAECAKLEQELSAAETSLAQTQAQLAAEAQRRTAAEGRAGQLGQERTVLKQELARAKASEEKLQSELEERRAQLEAASQGVSSERSNLEAQARELDVARAALEERARSESQLRAECARIEQELGAAETSLAQTQGELALAKASQEELQGQLEEKRAQLEAASEALATGRSNLEAKGRELDAARATLQERAQSESRLRGECARLEQELGAAETSLAQTQTQLCSAQRVVSVSVRTLKNLEAGAFSRGLGPEVTAHRR